jgi:NitT/TauT family transport system permease protein
VPRAKKVFDQVWPRAALVGAILLVWWAVYETGLIDLDKLPSPADVWNAFTTNLTGEDGLLPAARGSLIRLAFGLSVAVVVGTLIGFAMVASVVVQRSIGTLMTALQSLPSIAWLPLAIVWFDFSERAVMFVVFIGGVPAVAIATAISIRQVPPTLTRAARTMGAKGWTLQRTVVLPACIPGYWTGLQQAWAVAWRALLAAEIIRVGAARGLGHLLESSTQDLDLSLIIAAMGVIVVIGLAIDYGFSVVDRRIRGKRGSLVPA